MKLLFYPALFFILILTGCLRTVGVIDIGGQVIDEKTKIRIPEREIIVKALVRSADTIIETNAGQFSTDNTGRFTHSLSKIKNAFYYNFYIVGDSDYAFRTHTLGLSEMKLNAKFLTLKASKLVELKININRKTKIPAYDTLKLFWDSDGVDGRLLGPYKVINYGSKSEYGLMWVGGDIKATVRGRAYADKRTKIYWELVRNRISKDIVDTITCRRGSPNIRYFSY